VGLLESRLKLIKTRADLRYHLSPESYRQNRLKHLCIYSLITIALIVPYTMNDWWKFLPSLGLILILTRWKTRKLAKELGISLSVSQFLTLCIIFAVTTAVANKLVPFLLDKEGILQIRGPNWNLGWALMPVTQSLGEELVLRASLLRGLLAVSLNHRAISLFAALLFMIWHLVFFPFAQNSWLSVPTLFTLFLFGYATNRLFLYHQNIGVPLALHAGWNFVKFKGEFFDKVTQRPLSEALAFNAVEGSFEVLGLAICLVALSEIHVSRKWEAKQPF
jgi:hypothetical protein